MGSPINLFHGLDTNQPISLSLFLNSPKLKFFLESQLDILKSYLNEALFYFPITKQNRQKLEDEIGNDFEAYLDLFCKILDGMDMTRYKEHASFFFQRANINPLDLSVQNNSSIKRTYKYLKELCSCLYDNVFSYKFKIEYKDKKLFVSEVCIHTNSRNLLTVSVLPDGELNVTTDFIDIERKDIDDVNRIFIRYNTIFRCFQYDQTSRNMYSTFVRYLGNIVQTLLDELKDVFCEDRINYVSPLRAHPKRYYMLDKVYADSSLDTLDGDALAEVLKDNPTLKLRVNQWLSEFGFSVDVEEFKEIIHHLKVEQNGLRLDISDVGFGISQVLPVIIQAFLSKSDSVLIMEQPEIHLHPKMQADLCDLFISIVNKGRIQKRLLIETHSEYLLKRLRRRMAEQDLISSKDVSICLFSKTANQYTVVKRIEIEDRGYFEWPEEFYDGKIYEDTIEFLKLQGK